jgi:hypothetical protein
MTNEYMLQNCFGNKITKTKMDEFIKFYKIDDAGVKSLLKDLFHRGYDLPQPYLMEAQMLCAFGN